MTLVSETVAKEEYQPSRQDDSDDDDDDLKLKIENEDEDDDDASEAENDTSTQDVKPKVEDESDDEPLAAKLARVKAQTVAASEDDSDDEPLAAKLAKARAQKAQRKSGPAKRKKVTLRTNDCFVCFSVASSSRDSSTVVDCVCTSRIKSLSFSYRTLNFVSLVIFRSPYTLIFVLLRFIRVHLEVRYSQSGVAHA